ncbi:hypothetical protein [Streptomyces torulosus]|uniref:hypothetical protein n=1 Tax=Streptomyces torulosus TaxID=68276 RepID=UPI001470F393|nr:hypothetical protein [Streptomyces torulosus]
MHQGFTAVQSGEQQQITGGWSDDMSNMGAAYYPSTATPLGGDPLGRSWETTPPGTPSAGPPVDLRLVKGGGGAC